MQLRLREAIDDPCHVNGSQLSVGIPLECCFPLGRGLSAGLVAGAMTVHVRMSGDAHISGSRWLALQSSGCRCATQIKLSPLQQCAPGLNLVGDPGMAVTVEVDSVGLHPAQPFRLVLHGAMQAQKGHICLATGFGGG